MAELMSKVWEADWKAQLTSLKLLSLMWFVAVSVLLLQNQLGLLPSS
jgi:hypothetical protein